MRARACSPEHSPAVGPPASEPRGSRSWARGLALILAGPVVALSAPAPPRPIAEREAVPGRLRVRIFHSEPRPGVPGPAWTYVTDGFRAVGQKEMILAVLRRPEEDAAAFSEDPIRFFATLHPLAARGQLVSEGGHTSFGGSGFLGREDIRGMTYTRPDPFRSPLLQPDALVLVPLTAPELDAVLRFGALRVLGLLGHKAGAFPWPSFFDRARPSVVSAQAAWMSVLEKTKVVKVPGVRAAAEFPATMTPLAGQGNLVVSLPLASRSLIEEVVRPGGEAVALATELDPQADALAIFPPGSRVAAAIRAGDGPVSRLAGTFVTFLTSSKGDVARFHEDGFAVMLGEPSWKALRESLRSGRDLELLGEPGSMAIRVRWRD